MTLAHWAVNNWKNIRGSRQAFGSIGPILFIVALKAAVKINEGNIHKKQSYM